MSNRSDQELAESVRQNDPWAFEELFNRYWQDLFQTAYKKLQSQEDARDIVQEVWFSFLQNVKSIQVAESLAPYLFTVLRNKILQFFRKDKVRLAYVTNQLHVNVHDRSQTQQEGSFKELQAIVEDEVERMPARMKEVYKLSRQMHLQVSDIAEKLGLSPQTVKNQLYNALERLRKRLSQYDADLLVLFFLTCCTA